MIFQHFSYTNVQGHKFDLAVKRSKSNSQPSFNKIGRSSVPDAIYQDSASKLFGAGEEDIEVFLPYMGMTATLFISAEPFEQTVNTLSTDGPM